MSHSETPIEGVNERRARILIVDDEIFNLAVLEASLNQIGYTKIEQAHDGKQALDVLKNRPD
jgi:PleD family two-component response regulator